ncbi:MAG: phosphotransferase [Pseudomonadales bacterium]|nr:phosphotransferase [Pseudomonadales bacterium]
MQEVKPPNRRGNGISRVHRTSDPAITGNCCATAYVKTQEGYFCRTWWSLGRRVPTFRREVRALRRLQVLGIAVPQILAYDDDGVRARLVLAEVAQALPFDLAMATFPEAAERIVANAADLIARLHGAGWNHGALYPDHILVQGPPAFAVTLIDVEKAARGWWHRSDLDRLRRRTRFPTPQLAQCFERAYAERRH